MHWPNIRSQLAKDMSRKMNQKLISQVWGLVSAEGAPLHDTHVCDVSVCTGDVALKNTLSHTSVTGAKYLLGERAGTVDAIAVHPDVAAWLETAGMLTYTNVTSPDNRCQHHLGFRRHRPVQHSGCCVRWSARCG